MSEKEVLLHQVNNRHNPRVSHSAPVSFKQIEVTRTTDGARRLFRGELNGVVTGFIEKHFNGQAVTHEFALGGPKIGVTEAVATARFNVIDVEPAIEEEPVSKAELPDFLTKAEPLTPTKQSRPKPVPVSKVAPASKRPPSPRSTQKPMTRKDGLVLAGNLLKNR